MSLEVAPVTLSLIVVLNSVILNLPDPTSHNIPYLPWPPGGQGLAFDHTLIWRCDVTATSCCPRRLSTCRTIAVTIIVSPPSVRLPTASCCHLQENNEQYMACERKHFEGRLKFISCQAFNPGHLAWAASALPLSDINQTTISPHHPLYVLPAFSLSSILPHNIFICEQSITSGFSLWVDSCNVMNQ